MYTQRIATSLLTISAAALLAASPDWTAPAFRDGSSQRPNVLFIVADDLRTDLGCYDKPSMLTPHLDRLARTGHLFEQAFCQISVCGPSRASVLSGMRPDSTGIYVNAQTIRRSQLPNLVTLPQFFKENGYRSISIGKVFHHEERETGGIVSERPGDDPASWSEVPWHHGEPYQQWFNQASFDLLERRPVLPSGQRSRRGPPYEAAEQPDEVYPDGQIASKAIQRLRELKGEPFFLAVGFRRPHLPFNCPQKYWDLYPVETTKLPSNYSYPEDVPAEALHNGYELRSYAGMPKSGPISDEHAINLIRGYRAAVSFLDAQVGRLLQELDRLGLRENTIVVFWSDHGYHLGENGLWTKMTNFEVATRVPLILRVPGADPAPRRSGALVELVDIYPTLVELCGLSRPVHLEGDSMVPLLRDPDRKWKTSIFTQFPRRVAGRFDSEVDPMGRSIRTERYRYTEWTSKRDGLLSVELYDLRNDPSNNVNLAGRADESAVLARMAAQLKAGWREARPVGPIN